MRTSPRAPEGSGGSVDRCRSGRWRDYLSSQTELSSSVRLPSADEALDVRLGARDRLGIDERAAVGMSARIMSWACSHSGFEASSVAAFGLLHERVEPSFLYANSGFGLLAGVIEERGVEEVVRPGPVAGPADEPHRVLPGGLILEVSGGPRLRLRIRLEARPPRGRAGSPGRCPSGPACTAGTPRTDTRSRTSSGRRDAGLGDQGLGLLGSYAGRFSSLANVVGGIQVFGRGVVVAAVERVDELLAVDRVADRLADLGVVERLVASRFMPRWNRLQPSPAVDDLELRCRPGRAAMSIGSMVWRGRCRPPGAR